MDAVNSGALSEADLDRCVENFINVLVEMPVVKGASMLRSTANSRRKALTALLRRASSY